MKCWQYSLICSSCWLETNCKAAKRFSVTTHSITIHVPTRPAIIATATKVHIFLVHKTEVCRWHFYLEALVGTGDRDIKVFRWHYACLLKHSFHVLWKLLSFHKIQSQTNITYDHQSINIKYKFTELGLISCTIISIFMFIKIYKDIHRLTIRRMMCVKILWSPYFWKRLYMLQTLPRMRMIHGSKKAKGMSLILQRSRL